MKHLPVILAFLAFLVAGQSYIRAARGPTITLTASPRCPTLFDPCDRVNCPKTKGIA